MYYLNKICYLDFWGSKTANREILQFSPLCLICLCLVTLGQKCSFLFCIFWDLDHFISQASAKAIWKHEFKVVCSDIDLLRSRLRYFCSKAAEISTIHFLVSQASPALSGKHFTLESNTGLQLRNIMLNSYLCMLSGPLLRSKSIALSVKNSSLISCTWNARRPKWQTAWHDIKFPFYFASRKSWGFFPADSFDPYGHCDDSQHACALKNPICLKWQEESCTFQGLEFSCFLSVQFPV